MIELLQRKRDYVKNKMPKSLVAIFIVVALGFGMDLGFLEIINKKYRLITKIISCVMKILYILSIIYTFIQRFDYKYGDVTSNTDVLIEFLCFLFFWTLTVQLILYSVILMLKKYSVFDFMLDLSMIDGSMSFYYSEIFGVVSTVYILVMFFAETILTFSSCADIIGTDCDSAFHVLIYFYFFTPILCTDIVAFEIFLVYYNSYRFLMLIKESYKSSPEDVKILQDRYVSAVKCFDSIIPHCDRMLLIELLLDVPKLVGLLWGTLVYIKLQVPWDVYLSDYFSAFHVILQIVLPAWMAEKINSEVDDIKNLLHEQLLRKKEDDPATVRLVRYLEARPLGHVLWGVILVDLRLPAALAGLFTTYFIVIVQFTHVTE